jgi:methionyl-tRNA formyltransferase
MKILGDLIFLASDTSRSRAYIHALHDAGLLPSFVLMLRGRDSVKAASLPTHTPLFDNQTPLVTKLKELGVNFQEIVTPSINSQEVLDELRQLPQQYVVYSGPPGALLRQGLFDTGKRFLHVHPGRLPAFRGSTPMYYSLLAEQQMAATALFLNLKIDEGEIIREKPYQAPDDRVSIDQDFDPWMRADLLKDVLVDFALTGGFETNSQTHDQSGAYYIIHPVLKHLAIIPSEPSNTQND